MKINNGLLTTSLMCMMVSAAMGTEDLIEVPRKAEPQLLSLRPVEVRNESGAPHALESRLRVDHPRGAVQTDLWLWRPAEVSSLSFPDIEAAERINAEAMRRQREARERAKKAGSPAPIPPVYPLDMKGGMTARHDKG